MEGKVVEEVELRLVRTMPRFWARSFAKLRGLQTFGETKPRTNEIHEIESNEFNYGQYNQQLQLIKQITKNKTSLKNTILNVGLEWPNQAPRFHNNLSSKPQKNKYSLENWYDY